MVLHFSIAISSLTHSHASTLKELLQKHMYIFTAISNAIFFEPEEKDDPLQTEHGSNRTYAHSNFGSIYLEIFSSVNGLIREVIIFKGINFS